MNSDNMMKATYKAGYMDGHAAGYLKAMKDLEERYSKLDAEYRQACKDLAWYKKMYEVFEAAELWA